MKKITINVDGMSCGHCTAAVEGALKSIGGVASVEVSLEAKSAVVTFDEAVTDVDTLINAVEEQGFGATL